MIAIVNYGLGNVQAFANAFKRLNIPASIASNADDLRYAGKIVLPGVGAFDWAMNCLNRSGMRACLDELAMERKRPVLGVCVGMQIMARRSEEGSLPGLGWIEADVVKIDGCRAGQKTHLPHMGWNDVVPKRTDCLFRGIADPRFYFLHSYRVHAANPETELAIAEYGAPFAAAIRAGNVFGTQFHPEKSHQWGIQILKNFAELA